jgi:hypothetical protein
MRLPRIGILVPSWRNLGVLLAVWAWSSPSLGQESETVRNPSTSLPDFHLYTWVTQVTWPKLKAFAQEGDLFWGRRVEGIPGYSRALLFTSYDSLALRLETEDVKDDSAFNLDGEYRDFDRALEEAKKIRALIDDLNRRRADDPSRRPLRFTAFYHMRIIDAHPEIVKYPDVVLIGKSYWDSETLLGRGDRRRRSASKYVKLIREAGREPGILLGSPAKARHSTEDILKTLTVCLTPESNGGLGVGVIGFY